MKWKISNPKVGDTRTYIKFAWLPTFIETNNGVIYKVWLESYHVTEEFQETHVNSEGYYYRKAKWEVIKKELMFRFKK